jgi:hypothetical protein
MWWRILFFMIFCYNSPRIAGNMKSKKPKKSKKSKKTKKIKLSLFQEVCLDLGGVEMAVLISVCAIVFGIASSASGKLLYDYSQKEIKNAPSSQSEIQIVKSAVADEDQTDENDPVVEEAAAAEESLAKEKAAKVKAIAKQRAAQTARILSGPIPTGKTSGLSDGRRECTTKSLHPQKGGKVHVDEDCCADYNETPNPRCYYPPAKMGILKH